MKIKRETLAVLLEALAKKTKQSIDHYGLGVMSEKIGGTITQRYLYERVFDAVKGDVNYPKLSDSKLNELAKYLGHSGIEEFIGIHESEIDSQLLKCVGVYYSYVRRNLAKGMLYRSPVRIIEKEGKIAMELKGGRLKYSGEVRMQLGCLFVPLETKEGKAFYHIYKIGKAESPDVLQGTFSGVSNAEEPIAGRAVLVKTSHQYESLTNQEMVVAEMKKSKSLDQRRLAEYFDKYSENNLSLKKSYTFRVDDLGECR
jgi:hypothetical protein